MRQPDCNRAWNLSPFHAASPYLQESMGDVRMNHLTRRPVRDYLDCNADTTAGGRENPVGTARSRMQRHSGYFFALVLPSMAGRAGQSQGWPTFHRYSHPRSVCHHSVRRVVAVQNRNWNTAMTSKVRTTPTRRSKNFLATAQIIRFPSALVAPLPSQKIDRSTWYANVYSFWAYRIKEKCQSMEMWGE